MDNILQALKTHFGEYLSGEKLAKNSGITRAGVWKQIEHLRELGYTIESSPRHGYKLTALTPDLHPYEIQDGLATHVFGKEIFFQKEVDSTNRLARNLAYQGAREGTLVIAENQTQGKGRMGRRWDSKPGLGVWFSLILRPQVSMEALAGITILAAVVLSKAIDATCRFRPEIKWPNDLVFQGRKLAGILAEVSGEIDRIHYVVLGIGINVNHRADDFPPDLAEKAGSLAQSCTVGISRKLVLQTFLADFEKAYHNSFILGRMDEIIAFAKENSATLGKRVSVDQGFGKVHSGVARDLDNDGSLWLETASGGRVKIHSGELIENANSPKLAERTGDRQ